MNQRSWLVFVLLAIAILIRVIPLSLANPQKTATTMKLSSPPSLVIAGGNLRYDNAEVFQKIIELAGGEGAKIAVLPTASGNPIKSGNYSVEALKKYGAEPIFVPVAVENIDMDYQQAVKDSALIQKVEECKGVYFTGGSQERITQALYTETGEKTPLLDTIWKIYKKGGVIAGTSAGAAIMSDTMFRNAGNVLSVLKYGVAEGKEIDQGLGFIGNDIFIDQHFFVRGRFARSLVAMQKKGYRLGIGVDENTAVVVKDNIAEVIGYKGALVMDFSAATTNPSIKDFNIKNVKLTYLDRGDKFNLQTQEVIPHPLKLAGIKVEPNNPSYQPHFSHQKLYPDILANSAVADLMFNLIDNEQKEAIGLAFTSISEDEKPELGFEFKFSKGTDSWGYFTSAFGSEDYTVMNIHLDVTPIRMTDKLYEYISS
ncbi:cyanophycinase [Aerosakkonemataceae cyanobacterium BLCC-F154]|uniref:Cyanophycinase n=1 Tax=Floridaenema fluviatile BLCC-F154 TaxID=3153640 RepID=A0ABV4YEV3_9CYAN